MSSDVIVRFRLAACLTIISILSGCASGGINLVEEGRLRIETEAPEEITISVKGVYEEDELVEIKGVVWWQRGSPDELYSAHIDIQVVRGENTVINENGVPLRRIFVFRGGTRQRARFSGLVEPFVIEDATLRVIFHQGMHDEPAGGRDLPATPSREGTYR
jgi:hypothetical protein